MQTNEFLIEKHDGPSPVYLFAKRSFDILVASVALLLLCPIMLLVGIAIRIDSAGPILFRQVRVGRNFREFKILKFRTMISGAQQLGGPLTAANDSRVTRVGSFLRRTKLDELPQLINVLRGDMSLVGPRPEVPRYVEMFRDDYQQILCVRPGITDAASIRYRNEASILGEADDAEQIYVSQVLPEKLALARQYLRQSSFSSDLVVIAQTGFSLFR